MSTGAKSVGSCFLLYLRQTGICGLRPLAFSFCYKELFDMQSIKFTVPYTWAFHPLWFLRADNRKEYFFSNFF